MAKTRKRMVLLSGTGRHFFTTLAEPEHGPNILFSDDLPYSAKKLLELMTLYFHGKGRAMEIFLLKDCDGV